MTYAIAISPTLPAIMVEEERLRQFKLNHPEWWADHDAYLWWKRCSYEAGNYTFTTPNACIFHVHIIALRGCLATGDPKDVTSEATYATSNATVRAATMTTTVPGAQVWAGYSVRDPNHQLAVPAAFTTAETTLHASANTYRVTTGYRLDAAGETWGATGDQDGTVSSGATVTKNAMMVSVKTAAELDTWTGLTVIRDVSA